MFNFSLIQVNFINLSKFLFRYVPDKLGHSFFESLIVYKVFVLFSVLLLMVCITSSEQLKKPSIASLFLIVLVIISLWIKVISTGDQDSDNMTAMIHHNWCILIGNILYSVEGLSSVFTIRSSMEIPNKMGLVSFCNF